MTTTNEQSSREQEREALEKALDFIADHEDVIDGDNGPLPNRAMVLAAELRAVIAKAATLPLTAITAEEAGREGDAKPVRYEWRHFDTANTPHTWSAWHVVEPRNPYTDTMEDRVREYQGYIAAGYKYELRALYVGLLPPAPAQSGGSHGD